MKCYENSAGERVTYAPTGTVMQSVCPGAALQSSRQHSDAADV
jgi:hypothetical protein